VLGIVEMGIFGSVARGSASADSDLDVYVRTTTPNPYLLVHLKEAIEGRVHRKVDIVRMRERMNPMLKAGIEREGVDIDAEQVWWICTREVDPLSETIRRMIEDLGP